MPNYRDIEYALSISVFPVRRRCDEEIREFKMWRKVWRISLIRTIVV
jgi:hypothetical protein